MWRSNLNNTPSTKSLESVDLASPFASHEGSCFKENINVNKSDLPKLNVEPLQMKRTKKGGGYNLRKSLAWDRAFFTDEGVLDPLELSIITGASSREGLSLISEDTSGSSQLTNKSSESIKSNISKKFPYEFLGKDRKKHLLSPKLDICSSNIMTPRNVKTRVGSKSMPRCSVSPVPLPLSSLATVKTDKAAAKELKLPKVPCSRTGLSPVRTSKNSIPRAKCVDHNQNSQQVFSIQRNVGLRSFPGSLKATQTALNSSSLRSAHRSESNSVNSSSKGNSSVNINRVLVENADENSDSKIISDNMTPCKPAHSFDETVTSTAYFAQNAHNSYRINQDSYKKSLKPSGLRMPSPSLSFFSQPKSSASHDFSPRDTPTDICWSQRLGVSRLQETSGSSLKKDNCISKSTSSSIIANKNSQIQDLANKNRNEKIYIEDEEILNVDFEMPSQSGSYEHVIDDKNCKELIDDKNCKEVTHCHPVKGELCGSGLRNTGFVLELECAFHESEAKNAVEELTTCSSVVLNHCVFTGAQQCDEVIDQRGQVFLGTQEQASNPDCLATSTQKIDQLKHSPGAVHKTTLKDENILTTKERESELLGRFNQYRSLCSESANFEAKLHCQAKIKEQHDYLLNEVAFVDLRTEKIPTGEGNMQDAQHSSIVGGCENFINLISAVGDDTPLVVPTKENGNKSSDAKMENHMLPVERHGCNIDKVEMSGIPTNRELNLVDNSVLSKSCTNLTDMALDHNGRLTCEAKSDASLNKATMSVDAHDRRCQDKNDLRSHESNTVLFDNTADTSLLNNLNQETAKMEFGSSSKIKALEVSQKNLPGNVTDMVPAIESSSGNNCTSSFFPLGEVGSDMDSQSGTADGDIKVHSPGSSNVKQLECLELLNARTISENLSHSNEELQFENPLHTESIVSDEYWEDNNMDNHFSGHEKCVDNLRKSNVSDQETPLENESRCAADGVDAGADSSINRTLPNPTRIEICEDAYSYVNELEPKLDHVQRKSASSPNTEYGNDLKEKNRTLVLPKNIVPFSDEWLAAIEAAGEDILTKKSGAVQNSPTDKSLPNPGPWSPVKRKNNQIGPFDCTKFTNIIASDSDVTTTLISEWPI